MNRVFTLKFEDEQGNIELQVTPPINMQKALKIISNEETDQTAILCLATSLLIKQLSRRARSQGAPAILTRQLGQSFNAVVSMCALIDLSKTDEENDS